MKCTTTAGGDVLAEGTNLFKKTSHYCTHSTDKRKSSYRKHNWFVMLDAASFVGTNALDLSKYSADFVTISFYKMFGFPTGTMVFTFLLLTPYITLQIIIDFVSYLRIVTLII